MIGENVLLDKSRHIMPKNYLCYKYSKKIKNGIIQGLLIYLMFNKLKEHSFNIERFWSRNPNSPYDHITNNVNKIKIKN